MSKMKSKNQKRLAKFIVASLLFSGWSAVMPTVASAAVVSTITTTVDYQDANKTFDLVAGIPDSEGATAYSDGGRYVYGNVGTINTYYTNAATSPTLVASYNQKVINGNSYTADTTGVGWATLEAWVNDSSQKSGDVSGYTVNVNLPDGGLQEVVGGMSIDGTASGNTLNITALGGSTGHAFAGFATSAGGDVTGNTLNISAAEHIADAFGGLAYNGSATGNTVNMTGGQAAEVIGGSGAKGASSNTVNISGGKVEMWTLGGNVGWAGGTTAPADNNTINITGGEVAGHIIGGEGGDSASGNTVTISGSAVIPGGTMIVGGKAEYYDSTTYEVKQGAAANNTVNILIPLEGIGSLVGGTGDAATSTGNTLNLAAKNVSASSVSGFQNMNFYLPPDIANGDTMLTVNDASLGTPTDVQGVTFGVAALQGVKLAEGNTVNLITDPNGLTTDATLKTADSATLSKASFLAANNMSTNSNYELSISKSGDNTIAARVDKVTEEAAGGDQMKSPVETRAGVVTMINTGSDIIAGQGMDNAAAAVAASGGQSAPFAAMGGSSLRAESGSHVDTKGFNIGLGFAKQIENKSGKLLVGPVLEYGHGSYDSYQDNGITADGKSSYWGIGVIAKQTNNNGFYYEGSLRVGRTKSDYGSNNAIAGSHLSYDSKSTFWAAHLGAGKLVDIGHDNTLDYYGKYFYSHTAGDDVGIYRDGALFDAARFDAVNSHRLRVGARVTHALNEKNKIYGGLAYQYEFKGDARATYQSGGTAPSPSVKGGSGMLEVGWQVKPGSKNSPLTIDLGVTGWVGKQRGVTANLQANWTF